MILEKGIPKDLLVEGYLFRASNLNTYCVTLDFQYSERYGTVQTVIATVNKIDFNCIDDDIDVTKIKNGDKVLGFSLFNDWVIKLDISNKYYFPTFNQEKNQWYHNIENDNSQCLDDFTFILKEAYNVAIKVSEIEKY